jgi:hypothetical protein
MTATQATPETAAERAERRLNQANRALTDAYRFRIQMSHEVAQAERTLDRLRRRQAVAEAQVARAEARLQRAVR